MGELIAYRVALATLIASHPAPQVLRDRLQVAGESGVAVILGQPHPDAMLESFERAMRDIAALLPTPPR